MSAWRVASALRRVPLVPRGAYGRGLEQFFDIARKEGEVASAGACARRRLRAALPPSRALRRSCVRGRRARRCAPPFASSPAPSSAAPPFRTGRPLVEGRRIAAEEPGRAARAVARHGPRAQHAALGEARGAESSGDDEGSVPHSQGAQIDGAHQGGARRAEPCAPRGDGGGRGRGRRSSSSCRRRRAGGEQLDA